MYLLVILCIIFNNVWFFRGLGLLFALLPEMKLTKPYIQSKKRTKGGKKMQKNNQQATKGIRRRGLALLLSVFLIAGLALGAGTGALAADGEPSWELSVAITGGGASGTWVPGSEIKLTFTLNLAGGDDLTQEELEELLGNDIDLYINKEILPDGLMSWGNPVIGKDSEGADVMAFESGFTSSKSTVTDSNPGFPDGLAAGEYYKYTLKFNTSPEAMALWPGQFYIESNAFAQVTTETIGGGKTLIYATDGNPGSIEVGDTTNPPVKPDEPAADSNTYDSTPTIVKTMVSKMRQDANGAYRQFAGAGDVPLSEDDLVVFTITVTGGANGSTLNQITDTLGAGYELMSGYVNIAAWSGNQTVQYYLSNRYSNGSAVWTGSGPYTLTFDPPIKIAPGVTRTFGMIVKVAAGFSSAGLTNSATATYNGSSTANSNTINAPTHAKDAPLPDVALAVRITHSYNSAGGELKTVGPPGGVTVEEGGYIRLVHTLYNQYVAGGSGNVPIDSVTVRIYVPTAGYEWVTSTKGLVPANNVDWGTDKNSELSNPSGMWASDNGYYVYERTYNTDGTSWIACNANTEQLTAYLKVLGTQDEINSNSGDYYIASEIVGYSYRYDGQSVIPYVSGTSGPAYDADLHPGH
jgi:hypothetical protein